MTFPPPQDDGSINPKDAAALTRVPMHLLPAVGCVYGAMACRDGAEKYGPYNWRERKISLVWYLGAIDRHLKAVLDGEDDASDSKLPHLAHILATCAILLDAKEAGALIEDRPKRSGNASALIERMNARLRAEAAPTPQPTQPTQPERWGVFKDGVLWHGTVTELKSEAEAWADPAGDWPDKRVARIEFDGVGWVEAK